MPRIGTHRIQAADSHKTSQSELLAVQNYFNGGDIVARMKRWVDSAEIGIKFLWRSGSLDEGFGLAVYYKGERPGDQRHHGD